MKNTKEKEKNFIDEITTEIKKANKLSEVLKPETFAIPNGWADEIVRQLKKGKSGTSLKTSQLRKIFAEIKDICDKKIKGLSEDNTELYLLYPKLAYAKGRNLLPKDFYNLLVACLDKLKNSTDKEDFKAFEEFMTAIVAYNKQYE
ncbi:type III-A CRISPR-associated protein Csm2 [Hydrogenothermus marinus]|uniref:CRISPR system Cms protein Csm2 n=1 Tax=Hydrogenothermus marinus TaxID=133270 RepID=A0A3M0BS85_9AQUI|nr:type III-A CRISPR-associated protein Csm2 [Hydrogenothermus marinus]RMB00042.1 CRISPR-associated protein Csm2 [Hydrogenothermus marinus]